MALTADWSVCHQWIFADFMRLPLNLVSTSLAHLIRCSFEEPSINFFSCLSLCLREEARLLCKISVSFVAHQMTVGVVEWWVRDGFVSKATISELFVSEYNEINLHKLWFPHYSVSVESCWRVDFEIRQADLSFFINLQWVTVGPQYPFLSNIVVSNNLLDKCFEQIDQALSAFFQINSLGETSQKSENLN